MLSQKDRLIEWGEIRMHISPGNMKMGPIPGMNLMPVKTCSGSTPGCRASCYALKGIDFRSNMRRAWEDNTHAWMFDLEDATMLMARWALTHHPIVFRIHGSGDFISPAHLHAWNTVASLCPNTLFYGFSKAPFSLITGSENLRIRRSVWHDSKYVMPDTPTAHVEDFPDTLRLAVGENDTPPEARTCPATVGHGITCFKCRRCFTDWWEDGLPVVFKRH